MTKQSAEFAGRRENAKLCFVLRFVLALLLCCTLSGCRAAPTPPPFNVPALIGQPIATLTQTLGAPAQTGANQSSWLRDGATLTAQFKPNGRVTQLDLVSREPDRAVREGEQDKLLEPGQIPANATGYNLDYIEAPDRPLYYTGVKITPAPRTYKVELHLTGSQALLETNYALFGPQPQSEKFLTIAPWNLSAQLPDDAQIRLSARLFKRLTSEPVQIKVEIVVDGKAVASQSSAGASVACAYEL